ncbi:branched-chain amino acid ABC transporter permease [Clostridiales bacterium COT073_COT-073]|nr:branched-chain amino acid ABC transporter permease [Clostridiales bacterium COT073_COT-073]
MERKNFQKNYLINFIAVLFLFGIIVMSLQMKLINNYYQGLLIIAGINIMAASSLNLAAGYMGQLALGHAGFMAIGAYTAALIGLHTNLPVMAKLIVGIGCGGVMAGLFGVLIGIPALRLRGDYLGIVTLGFGEIIRIALYNLPFTGGAAGLKKIPKLINLPILFVILVLVISFLFLFVRSRHGRALLSIKEDEIAAESVGVPTIYYKVYGFAVSAFLAGVAGGCLAYFQRALDPNKFKFMLSVEFFIIVVLGGMGSFTGTILAGLFLAFINEFLYEVDELRLVIYAVLLIVVMIFKPSGLLGNREFSLTASGRWLKRKLTEKK